MTKERKNRFLFGAALGTLFGFLFAPKKGKETREQLSENVDKLKDTLEGAVEEGAKKISEVQEEAKPYVESLKKGLEGDRQEETEE